MKNQIEIVYSGNLRTSSKHILSNNSIITDAPLDNQGKGEAFSPTDSSFCSWELHVDNYGYRC